VELCFHAHESLVRGLGALGFLPKCFETVFFREFRSGEVITPHVPLDRSVRIEIVDPSDTSRALEVARTLNQGFATTENPPVEADEAVWRRCMAHPRTRCLAAFVGGKCVGAGSLEILTTDDLAALDPQFHDADVAATPTRFCGLFGAAVLPEFRRIGIQSHLIARRLELGLRAGAAFATISGSPGAGTERNVRRYGFQVAYAKVHMHKPSQAPSQSPTPTRSRTPVDRASA
jgi:GNAT superfamily N-acetyltransferase